MAQFQPPLVFTPGQVLTASDLNAHISSAILLPGAIHEQTAMASNSLDVLDEVLVWDASIAAIRRTTVSDLLNSGIAASFTVLSVNSISADAITGKTEKDIFLVPNDGVAVTGKTFSSIDGINVAVSSLSHGLVVGQWVLMTCSNTAYSGLYRISAASTNDFNYVLNASVTAGSGTCSYTKKASLPVVGNVSITGNEYVGGDLEVAGNPYFKANTAIKIPSGTTAQRPSTPIQGQLRYNTTTSNTEIYTGTTWEEVGGGPFDATGGNKIIAPDTTVVSASFTSANGESVVVTSGGHSVSIGQIVRIVTAVAGYSGDFQVIAADAGTFTYVMPVVAVANSGSCTYQKAGNFKCHIFTSSGTFTAGGKGGNVEVLVVGGGGGGGGSGGGGGAVVYYPYYNLSPGQIVNVTVGTGGAASTNGTASVFGTISAGGGNGSASSTGASSGVGTLNNPSYAGGTYYSYAAGGATVGGGGGGGGAGGAALSWPGGVANYASTSQGGPGKGSNISGIPKRYGGGGSGSITKSMPVDGGGAYNGTGIPAEANSGGGGAATAINSANIGADGIVIVRYPYWL